LEQFDAAFFLPSFALFAFSAVNSFRRMMTRAGVERDTRAWETPVMRYVTVVLLVAALLAPLGVSAQENAPVPVPPPTEKALSFYHSGNVLWAVDQVWALAIVCAILFTGSSARIRNWAGRLTDRWFLALILYFTVFTALNYGLTLPLEWYRGFVRLHAYGLSNQRFAKWFGDSLKELAIGWIAGSLLLWIPYTIIRKSPRRWWLYCSFLSVPFLMMVMLITPVWIDPLFNHFGPMKDKALEGKIIELAERAGIDGSRVYEVDKSADTNALNAYVTGFMGSKRIVLWDTMIAASTDKELMTVMAHEMGHYVLGHVTKSIVLAFFMVLATLYLSDILARRLMRRFRRCFGFDTLSDVAALPLLVLAVGLFSFLLSPLALAYSRYQEHEADRFSLELTRENHAAALTEVKALSYNLIVPRPGLLYVIFRASHPSVADRIDFANTYRPWETGASLRYGPLFKGNRRP
jgi:STE24 endopeptidase